MKSFLFSTFLLFFFHNINAQVGIGTTSPFGALDVVSTTDGLLIPRVALTATNIATVLTPTVSELVYNSATSAVGPNQVTPGYYYWDGSLWIRLATGSSSNAWALLGNAGTSAATNFLGTTDDIDLVFRRNNIRAGFIGNPTYNLSTFDSNNGNTSFGANSLLNPTINVATQTGVRNSVFGANVMPGLTTGQRNTGIGDLSLFSNTSGSENIAVGSGALYSNTISSGHVAIGRSALTSFNGPATADIGNTAVGFTSLRDNIVGTCNSALGYRALRASTGSNNTAIGFDAGLALTTGSNNIMIGANTVAPVAAGSDQLNIGNTFFGSMAGVLTAGVNTTRTIGINVIAPQGALDITSSNNGLLIPRVALINTTTVLPVTTGRTSEIVYNTATINDVTPGFYFLSTNTGPWVRFATGSMTGWSTTGNAGLTAGTNFIGTTDAVDVSFKRSNAAAGYIGATSTAFGVSALNSGASTNSTAFGNNALSVSSGSNNVAFGQNALRDCAGLAQFNTAVGTNALQSLNNAASQRNTVIGFEAMGSTTGDISNCTAVGFQALYAIDGSGAARGINNTAVGYQAGNTITTGENNVAIGYLAQVPSATSNGQVRIGNTSISYAGVQVGWTITSDKRWKSSIKDSELGLNFLKTLRPVSYTRTNDEKHKTEYGFIAQELDESFNKAGDPNNGVISKDDAGMLGVRYNDFISISVKAIQEQQLLIEELQKANAELLKANAAILKRLESLEEKKIETSEGK